MDWLSEPLSQEAPCGPDLEQAADPGFIEYYFAAEAALPERYLLPSLFDPASVDIRRETAMIEALLKRSRDLRLVSLLARFEILAARPKGFADALEAMVRLLETWPEAAHPALPARAPVRRAALDALASTPWVVMPLQYLPLNGMSEVTLRRYQVATGAASAREGEDSLGAAQILDLLRSPGNRAKAAATQADLSRAAAALRAIAACCAAIASKPMQLDFSRPLGVIAEAQALIATGDPTMPAWTAPEPDAPPADTPPTEGGLRAPGVAQTPAAAPITSVAHLKVVLTALEQHLARTEPSSAALLLVTQARLLVGKSLVEALETLLPTDAAKAVIDFGTGFVLPMDRLRALAAESRPTDTTQDGLTPPPPPPLRDRADLAAQMQAVEAWYRRNEPTSPIPVLLTRARTSLDKDFEALVTELLSSKQK